MDWLKRTLAQQDDTEAMLRAVQKELKARYVDKQTFDHAAQEAERLREASGEAETLRTELAALREQYEADTGALREEVTRAERSGAIEAALCRSGARSTKLVRAVIDESQLTWEDGTIGGLEEQLTKAREEYGYLFGADAPSALPLGTGGEADDAFSAAARNAVQLGRGEGNRE